MFTVQFVSNGRFQSPWVYDTNIVDFDVKQQINK